MSFVDNLQMQPLGLLRVALVARDYMANPLLPPSARREWALTLIHVQHELLRIRQARGLCTGHDEG
jgi:hypothetical protein